MLTGGPGGTCTANASGLLIDEKTNLENIQNSYEGLLKSYKSIEQYYKSLKSIIASKKKELNKFSNKVDTYKQNLYIDGRKDNYENKNYDFYKTINFYIIILYYSLLVCYFIFSSFFQEKKYNNRILVLLIILYISIPFIISYLLSLIHYGYEYIIETNNLRGEIISYPYIIEDREKYE